MSAEQRHARIKKIFLAAREQASDQQQAIVDRLSEGDEDLRHEVETLLRRDQDEPSTTEVDELGAMAQAFVHVTKTPSIPNFRVLQKIGEGGMGEVYEAEQLEPVRRRVALKVLKAGFASKEVVARFESERQALAIMNHPNIARVFEAGLTDHEQPYLSMELVPGEAITDYCDRHRLTTEERLHLFIKVCSGVQHAHQKGIIHRDIKPSNVLVALEGKHVEPKIIDFGLAKATAHRLTEHTLFTERGQWIGTPEYMSPEQAEMTGLDIDTRTDVYSLGVLLYELLAGARPFDSESFRRLGLDEVRRRIRDEEPTRPSTKVSGLGAASKAAAHNRRAEISALVQQLRGDLDWVTLKALEKDRTRRYESPLELATDIRRHLSYEPVLACPPTTLYKLSKFIRRNRIAVVAGSLITAAVLLGLLTTSMALVKAKNEGARAQQVASFLDEMLLAFDPFADLTVASSEQMLDRAVVRLENDFAAQALVQARLMRRISTAYRNRDLFERGLPLAERALGILRQELGEDHSEVVSCLFELSSLAFEAGDYQRAHDYSEQAVEIQRRVHPLGDPRISIAETQLGFSLWALGKYTRAEKLLQTSLVSLEHARGENDLDVAVNLLDQGILFNNMGNYRDAISVLERAVQIRTAHLGSDNPHVCWASRTLARAHYLSGQYDEALLLGQRALDCMKQSFGPHHTDLSFTLDTLGQTNTALSHFSEAQNQLEKAVALRQASLGPDHPELGLSLKKLASFYLEVGDLASAGSLLEQALNIDRRRRPAGHPETAMKLHLLSRQRSQKGEIEAAISLQREALELVEPVFGLDHVLLGAHLAQLGHLLLLQGDLEQSRPLLERALHLHEQQYGLNHRRIADVLRDLAALHSRTGNELDAGQLMNRALTMYEATLGPDHPAILAGLRGQAQQLRRLGETVAAAESEHRAMRIESGLKTWHQTPSEDG